MVGRRWNESAGGFYSIITSKFTIHNANLYNCRVLGVSYGTLLFVFKLSWKVVLLKNMGLLSRKVMTTLNYPRLLIYIIPKPFLCIFIRLTFIIILNSNCSVKKIHLAITGVGIATSQKEPGLSLIVIMVGKSLTAHQKP